MDDGGFRLERRLRRRERRQFRRFQVVVPIGFVALAMLLSAGVVKVMEDPRPQAVPAAETPAPAEPVQGEGTPESRLPMAPPPGAELQPTLSTSILDGDIEKPVAPDAEAPAEDVPLEPVEPAVDPDAGARAGRRSPAAAPYWTMSSSSTSNVRAAPGGIAGGAPRSP